MPGRWMVVLAMGLMLGSCGDSAGPDELDVTQMTADIALPYGVEPSLESAIVLEGLDASGELLGGGGSMPDSVKGRVWEYDVVAAQYAVSERTGAPTDGARIILYQLDETGGISIPLVEAGYFDMRELGNSVRREGRLVAVVHDVTLYDLSGFATGTAEDGTLGIDGYAVLNGLRMEITGEGSVRPAAVGSATLMTETLKLPQRDVHIEATISQPASSSPFTSSALATSPAGQLEIFGTGGENSVGGLSTEFTLSLNGEEFATQSRENADEPVFQGLNGHSVTVAHEALFEAAVDMSYVAGHLQRMLITLLTPALHPVPW